MKGIEFDLGENQSFNKTTVPKTEQGFLLKFLERRGIVDPTVANSILLGVAVLFFGLTIFVYAGALAASGTQKLTPEQVAAEQKVFDQMRNPIK